jgi:hypothetical protein
MTTSVTLTVVASSVDKKIKEAFIYDFDQSEKTFLEKMKSEISMQMNKNVSTTQLKNMLISTSTKAVYQFSCVSDWLATNLPEVVNTLQNSLNAEIKELEIDSFIIKEKKKEIKLTPNHKDLREVFSSLSSDLSERVRSL